MYLSEKRPKGNECSNSCDYPMFCETELGNKMQNQYSLEFNGPSSSVITLHKSEPYVQVNNQATPCWDISNSYPSCSVSYLAHNKIKQYYTPEEFCNYIPNNQIGLKLRERNHGPISNTTKSPHDTLKTIKKRKRKRTMFTTEQIIALEEVFHRKPYINREERIATANKLQVSEKSIKVWFQNRRRLTEKKNKDDEFDSLSSEDLSYTRLDRLTIIESQINENTNEYGYVTLDNRTMSELVSVIDEYLSLDCNHVEEITSPIVSNIMMYEPISPVSSTDNSEDVDQTEDFAHHETSQRLTDIETLLFS